jgi:hypothetical protein
MTRAPRRLRRLGVAVTALVALTLAACDPPPDEDAFYTPPASLPSQPGAVIRSRTSTFTLDPLNRTQAAGIRSWQVLYRSTDATGGANAVSGTVLVPDAPWTGSGPRPLVVYAPGTRGVGDDCAPSYTLAHGTDYEMLFIKALLDQGWAVTISDYEGLGTPGTHTYVVGQSEGRALIDAARATLRLSATGLSSSAPVAFYGYSQGGGAAGWAAQMESTYGSELNVRATVAGGIPGDLTAVAEFLEGSPFVALELLASIGLDAAYPELDLEDYVNDRGRELLAETDTFCLTSVDGIATVLETALSSRMDYVHTDPLATPQWKARLAENKLGATKPAAPVFQYHALFDEMVELQQASDLRRTWCNRGANVTWSTLPLAEHALGLVEGQPLGIAWLSARFAGIPTFGNCLLP